MPSLTVAPVFPPSHCCPPLTCERDARAGSNVARTAEALPNMLCAHTSNPGAAAFHKPHTLRVSRNHGRSFNVARWIILLGSDSETRTDDAARTAWAHKRGAHTRN